MQDLRQHELNRNQALSSSALLFFLQRLLRGKFALRKYLFELSGWRQGMR